MMSERHDSGIEWPHVDRGLETPCNRATLPVTVPREFVCLSAVDETKGRAIQIVCPGRGMALTAYGLIESGISRELESALSGPEHPSDLYCWASLPSWNDKQGLFCWNFA